MFTIEDSGVGVFRNIMQKRKLDSPVEAIQDLLKGKTTTMPKSHSGEGIFFTSRAADSFMLDSFGHQLVVIDTHPDMQRPAGKNINTQDRLLRASLGLGLLLLAIFTTWHPLLLFASGFCFFEAIFSWCLFNQLTGRNSCSI